MFRIIQTCSFVIFRGLYIPGWWRVSRWFCQQKCVEIWSEPWLLAGNGAYECVQIWTRYDFASIRCGLKQLQMFTTEVNEHLFRVSHHFFELCICWILQMSMYIAETVSWNDGTSRLYISNIHQMLKLDFLMCFSSL